MSVPSLHVLSPADNDMLANCAVHSRTEILHLLRSIHNRKLLVNLDLPESRQIVVTSIIAIDERNNALILDSARGDALNHELMSGKDAEFITQLDGVSISFSTGHVTLCEYEKMPALRIAIPKSLIRLQRREHFRVQLPIINSVKCVVPSTNPEDSEPITAYIVDISCGGVAIAERGGRIGGGAGRVLTGCRLLLPEGMTVTTSLEVRNSAQIRLQNGAFQTRLGCKFVDLPNDMATMLQRFVMNIERARRNSL